MPLFSWDNWEQRILRVGGILIFRLSLQLSDVFSPTVAVEVRSTFQVLGRRTCGWTNVGGRELYVSTWEDAEADEERSQCSGI